MAYADIIHELLKEQWQYFSDKALLVLAIGTQNSLHQLGLIDDEGYLDIEFKSAFTQTLLNTQLIDGTTGPFDDDDYFSGIEDENGLLHYYFEMHNMEQEQVLAFLEQYPVVFIMSEEEKREL